MKKINEERFDEIVRKVIKEVGLEEPSPNFTDAVLSKIELANKNSSLTYRRLIPKGVWATIFVLFIIIFSWAFVVGDPSVPDVVIPYHLENNLGTGISTLLSFEFSDTFTYGIIAFTIFALFQIVLIKQRFENRYAMN